MKQRSEKSERLIALFVIGIVILNFPVLGIADTQHTFIGVPILYLYLFGVWAMLIVLVTWIIERR